MNPRGAAPSTRLIDASPQAQLRRLADADRRLVLLLVSLGAESARSRVELLAEPRRSGLAPLVESVLGLDRATRHTLFHAAPPVPPRTPRAEERPRLARLMRADARLRARDGRLGRGLAALASRPRPD